MGGGAWLAAVHGVAKSQTRLSDFTFTFHFHALEKEMATHSTVLAWRILGTGEPCGLPSMGSHRVRCDWSDLAAAAVYYWMAGSLLEPQMLFCDAGDLGVWPRAWLHFTDKSEYIFRLISGFNVLFISPFLYQRIMALITPVLLFFFSISSSFWVCSILCLALVKLLESSFVTSGLGFFPLSHYSLFAVFLLCPWHD